MSEDTTCPSIAKPTRIIAYYIQGGIGLFLLISNTLSIFGAGSSLIVSILLLLTASLWIMSPKSLIKKLTEPIRLFSFVFLILFLFLFYISGKNILIGYLTCAAAIWYFLSFVSKGQELCRNCVGSCCKTCFKVDPKSFNLI